MDDTLKDLEARATEVREARASKTAAATAAKRSRDLLEEIETDALLDEPANRRMKIDTAADFPGWIVFRLPKPAEASRFRHIMFRDAGTGVVEAKAKAGGELALSCVVHPERASYLALVASYPTLPDAIAKAVLSASDAEAEAEEKG